MFLETGNSMDLFKAEKAVSFNLIFETNNKPFLNVPADRQGELLNSISILAQRFLQVNFPDVNAADVANQFAVDLIDMRCDWSLLDVLNFFKFIRQRQDLEETKIFGNAFKITPMVLNKLAAVYEDHKAIARTIWHQQETSKLVHGTKEERLMLGGQKLIGTDEQFKDTRFSELAKKLTENENKKTAGIYERAADTKKFLDDMQIHWEEQVKLVSSGQITQEQSIYNHNKYRIEYAK
jgi:hypothetical protein